MLFLLAIMQTPLDQCEKEFCHSLKSWFENHYEPRTGRGAVTRCAKFLGVSQGHFSKILKGEKCWRSESDRRKIAKKIGFDYGEMIGIHENEPDKFLCVAEQAQPYKPEIKALLAKAREVMESNTPWADNMRMNIISTHTIFKSEGVTAKKSG
jgi:hypothetical protein